MWYIRNLPQGNFFGAVVLYATLTIQKSCVGMLTYFMRTWVVWSLTLLAQAAFFTKIAIGWTVKTILDSSDQVLEALVSYYS